MCIYIYGWNPSLFAPWHHGLSQNPLSQAAAALKRSVGCGPTAIDPSVPPTGPLPKWVQALIMVVPETCGYNGWGDTIREGVLIWLVYIYLDQGMILVLCTHMSIYIKYIFTHTLTYTHNHTYIHIHIHTYTYTYTYTHTHTHTHTHAHTQTHTHIYICICVYIYIYTFKTC